jgi:GTP-binding protein
MCIDVPSRLALLCVQGQSRVKYEIPTRGLLGLKNALLSSTRGQAVLNTQFLAYKEFLGDFSTRELGSLAAFETGQVTAYALQSAQERGVLFCKPGDQVYEGQVVGIHQRAGDLKINVCKKKALTNMRAAGKDNTVALDGVKDMSLDDWCAFSACACPAFGECFNDCFRVCTQVGTSIPFSSILDFRIRKF